MNEEELLSYLNTILAKVNDSATGGLDDALWGISNVLGNAGRGDFNVSDNFNQGRDDAYANKQSAFEQNPTLKGLLDAGEMGIMAGGVTQLGKMGVNALRNKPQAQPQPQPQPQAPYTENPGSVDDIQALATKRIQQKTKRLDDVFNQQPQNPYLNANVEPIRGGGDADYTARMLQMQQGRASNVPVMEDKMRGQMIKTREMVGGQPLQGPLANSPFQPGANLIDTAPMQMRQGNINLMNKPKPQAGVKFPTKDEVTNSEDLLQWAKDNIDNMPNEYYGAVSQQGANMPRGLAGGFDNFTKQQFQMDSRIANNRRNKDDPYKRGKKIGSSAIMSRPLSSKAFNEYTDAYNMTTKKPTYFTRVEGKPKFGDENVSVSVVNDPGNIDSVKANQYLTYKDGTLYRADDPIESVNMFGNGQRNEMLVKQQVLDDIISKGNAKPVSEVTRNLEQGKRILGAGGGGVLTQQLYDYLNGLDEEL